MYTFMIFYDKKYDQNGFKEERLTGLAQVLAFHRDLYSLVPCLSCLTCGMDLGIEIFVSITR